MASSSNHNSDDSSNTSVNSTMVPITTDDVTFEGLQSRRMKELENRLHEEVNKKRNEWETHVVRMKEEFLRLYPCDKEWGSDELISDPYIRKRRGSTDVLDRRKMKTLYGDFPESGRKFKLRFDVGGYERNSIQVRTEGERLIITAIKKEESDTSSANSDLVDRTYIRKIEKPKDVDISKLKSILTMDGVLIVEAPLPPQSLNLRKFSHSPSHSSHGSHGSHGSRTSIASSRSRSPSNSPGTPSTRPKYGIPVFRGEEGERSFSLIVDIGDAFKPKEITVQIIKDNIIQVKAKHEERTSERMTKAKFSKVYELSEKIETYSMRAGLTESGKLVIGALGKGHIAFNKNDSNGDCSASRDLTSNSAQPCNVLDLASFPPVNLSQTMTSSQSASSS